MTERIEPPQLPVWSAGPVHAIDIGVIAATVAACRTVVCDGKV